MKPGSLFSIRLPFSLSSSFIAESLSRIKWPIGFFPFKTSSSLSTSTEEYQGVEAVSASDFDSLLSSSNPSLLSSTFSLSLNSSCIPPVEIFSVSSLALDSIILTLVSNSASTKLISINFSDKSSSFIAKPKMIDIKNNSIGRKEKARAKLATHAIRFKTLVIYFMLIYHYFLLVNL